MTRSEPANKVRPAFDEGDERLLIEAAQEDRARFADVYERYFELVYGYVARRVRDRARSEDLTSEVFRKALTNLPRFKWTGAPFGAWLLRIASNTILDRLKRDGREASMTSEAGNPQPVKEAQHLALEDAEQRARVLRLVDELAEDQRRVILMRFAEEKSVREIALALGRSEGSVKQLQFRAFQNLRKAISPDTNIKNKQ